MRIGFLLNSLSGGGAERATVTVANALAAEGHQIGLVLNRRRGPYLADVAAAITLTELGGRMLFALPKLLRVLRRARFDAIFTILDQPSIAALLLKPLLGRTKIVVIECNNPLAGDAARDNPVWAAVRRLRPILYPRADHLIAKSDGIRRALIAAFNVTPERVTTVPNPIDAERVAVLAAAAPAHPWLDVKTAPTLVAVGRLCPQKDFATLLGAFATLCRDRPLKLIILGEGPERAALRRRSLDLGIGAVVDFPGFAANPYAVVARADCFVLSSRWEGWPNALVEALACGTPVVATDCETGPRDILEGGRHGKLVPVGDAAALARAIAASLDSPADSAALRRCVAGFTPQRIAAQYYAVASGGNR